MPLFDRLKYAFFLTVIVIGILTVVSMLFSLDIGEFVFSKWLFVPVVVIAFLFAPVVQKYIKFK